MLRELQPNLATTAAQAGVASTASSPKRKPLKQSIFSEEIVERAARTANAFAKPHFLIRAF